MKVQVTVEVEVRHLAGKFASKENVADAILELGELPDEGDTVDVVAGGEFDSEYEVVDVGLVE